MIQELKKEYEKLNAARASGNRKDKVKATNEIRNIERQSARDGRILHAIPNGDSVTIEVEETDSKRSLQEEYCRKHDDEVPVNIGGREQTLRQYHKRRLLGGGSSRQTQQPKPQTGETK